MSIAEIGDNRRQLVTQASLAQDFGYVDRHLAELEAEFAKAPPVLEDDEDLEVIRLLSAKARGAYKRCEELRDETKRPHLEAGRTIDAFFKALSARMEKANTALMMRATLYLDKKRAAEEARRRAEEARQRQEAERKSREAEEAASAGEAERAARAAAAAAEAESRAHQAAEPVKATDLARTQTAGGTATLSERWMFEITDFSALDLNALRPYLGRADIEKAIRALVRAGRRQLAGVRIFQETKARLS